MTRCTDCQQRSSTQPASYRFNEPRSRRSDPAISHCLFSVKLSYWCCLLLAHATGGDFGLEVVFAANGTSGKAAQHGNLPGVGQRVGNWTLEELLYWESQRLIGCQVIVERLHGFEEALHVFPPGERR